MFPGIASKGPEGTVLAAHSRVTHDFLPWRVYAGVPARPVRPRLIERMSELEHRLCAKAYSAAGVARTLPRLFGCDERPLSESGYTGLHMDVKTMIPVARPSLPPLDSYVTLLEEIWNSRMLSNFGTYAQLLESKAQAYLGNPYVRVVANCDLGLTIALSVLEIPKGSECILPSFTFNSTVNAVMWNSLVPVFADIDLETFTVDPVDVEAKISAHTAAIFGAHTFGNPCKVDQLQEIADRAGVQLLFDAAHAYGARHQGKPIGALQVVEVFSLSATKPTTSAEGGLVAATSLELARRIEHLRNYGFLHSYESKYVGLNAKISELNAALGSLTIDEVEAAITRRNDIAARYRAALKDIGGIRFQRTSAGDLSALSHFAIVCETGRDRLEQYLWQRGIQTRRYFLPLHQMQLFAEYSHAQLPCTEFLAERILCLPMWNELTDSQIDFICDTVRNYYKDQSTRR